MPTTRALRHFARKNIALLAAAGISALTATPVVMSASRALAVSQDPGLALRVAPVEVGLVETAPAAVAPEACLRKVRVVYGGYGTREGCAAR